jgi:membrane glycosyltransferase
MLQVVRFASMTWLQGLMIFFFGLSLAWIAFAAGSVIAGASKRRDPRPSQGTIDTLTALVMPIYNEDPTRTTAALQSMAEALGKLGTNQGFEIVVLSDSTNADAWIRETVAVDALRRSLADVMPVWYRRRWRNVARKSGNIEDFVSRWGGRYDHMIVLDADSLIDLRPPAAVRGLRLWPGNLARARGLVRGQRQLLGPQRHHPRAGVRAELRPAGARRTQALRRPRALA